MQVHGLTHTQPEKHGPAFMIQLEREDAGVLPGFDLDIAAGFRVGEELFLPHPQYSEPEHRHTWRDSFTLYERDFILKMTPEQRLTGRVVKALRDHHGNLDMKSYLIKTLLITMVMENPADLDYDQLGLNVISFLKRLHKNLMSQCFLHHTVNQNLLARMGNESIKSLAHNVGRMVTEEKR